METETWKKFQRKAERQERARKQHREFEKGEVPASPFVKKPAKRVKAGN